MEQGSLFCLSFVPENAKMGIKEAKNQQKTVDIIPKM
jgi:hypothetical protein